jgi:prolyl oligopeptidase
VLKTFSGETGVINFLITILASTIFIIGCQAPQTFSECGPREERSPNGLCIQVYSDPITGMPRTPEDLAFVKSENQRTDDYSNSLDPVLIKSIKDRAIELTPKNAPIRPNYFGEEYGVKDGSLVRFKSDGQTDLVIPGSVLPKDSGFAAYRISPDQTKIAFAYSKFGSDWQTWQIFDLEKKEILKVDGSFTFKGFGGLGMAWTLDSKSLLFSKDTPIENDFQGLRDTRIYKHELGEPPQKDKMLFDFGEPTQTSRWSAVAVTEDIALIVRIQGVATIPMAAYVVNIKTGERKQVVIPNKYLGSSPGNGVVGVRDGVAYIRSAQAGKNFGILSIDVAKEGMNAAAKVLISNDRKSSLYQATIVADKIVTQNINKDLTVEYRMYNLEGKILTTMKPSEHGLSDWGHPSLPFMEANATSTEGYFSHSSVEFPPVTFKVNAKEAKFIRMPGTADVPFDPTKVKRRLVTYKSHDGKKIQMFIYQRADMVDQPAKFAYLYSYGFIGIPNLPQWNRKFQLALELGGVVAVPVIRGGGEFGVDSQMAGTDFRWHTLKDLVYASRWLKKNVAIEEKRVVAVGRSFGGLTGAAHFVHHQKEFDLISAIVPVTDWQKHFEGSGWWMGDDFGIGRDPVTGYASQQDVKRLEMKNSQWNPLSHVKKLKGKKLIPAIFFSGQFDTNTTPHQTFNFARIMREQFPDQPFYMKEHANGGHGSRLELVDEFLFIAKQFGLTELKPLK